MMVPLGHWNWKWNPTRQKYNTYEQELLSGILTIATNYRFLVNLPIVWFCDNDAVKTFLDNAPPTNKRLRRWYCYLSQFQLRIMHIPGLKNEATDFLSRNAFDEKINNDSDQLAKEAFARMDKQLDLTMQCVLRISHELNIEENDYNNSEWKEIWKSLEIHKSNILDSKLYYRTKDELFCERRLVIPENKLNDTLLWSHRANGHPGADRTVWFFLQNFHSHLTRKELLILSRMLLSDCQICLKSKPNTAIDRGLVGNLPIPQLANDVIFVDFFQMDNFNNFDYVLTIVDGLTRFVKFVPCTKNITGEATLKLILREWIQNFGKPKEIFSDNDVRFAQEKGFYQSAFKMLGIDVHFSIPRHPQSNGLCERMNRSFLQNARALSMDLKTMDWPKLCPMVSWLLNSQVSGQTGYTPSELFLGRPSWKFSVMPEPCTNPCVKSWLEDQMSMQEEVCKRLEMMRDATNKRANKGRTRSSYSINDYVLIHKSRWPQKKLPKLESPWLGPFKICEVFHNSLQVMVSPNLGGLIKVSLAMVKKWSDVYDLMDNVDVQEDQEIQQIETEQEHEEMNKDEMEEQGFFTVNNIIKHKFHQGWRFLTHWEGYPVDASTWEPIKAFKLPDGRLNSKFLEYCEQHNLSDILKKALKG